MVACFGRVRSELTVHLPARRARSGRLSAKVRVGRPYGTQLGLRSRRGKSPAWAGENVVDAIGAKIAVLGAKIDAQNSNFTRLGLTDAALLELVSEERPLITVDCDLCGSSQVADRTDLSC